MLKVSASLKEMATNVAKNMLEKDLMESDIPEMPSFRVSRTSACPNGYVLLGDTTVEKVTFYLFQMF